MTETADVIVERCSDEVAVALCFYGKDLNPAELTQRLGVAPTHSHIAGERKGPKSPPFERGAWILELRRVEPIDLDSMYFDLLSPLPHHQALWEELCSRFEARIDFAVHTDAGCGFHVSPETMNLIASMGCSFNISIFAYGASDA